MSRPRHSKPTNLARYQPAFECPGCHARALKAEVKWKKGDSNYRCTACGSRFRLENAFRHTLAMNAAAFVVLAPLAGLMGYLVGGGYIRSMWVALATVVLGLGLAGALAGWLILRFYIDRRFTYERVGDKR